MPTEPPFNLIDWYARQPRCTKVSIGCSMLASSIVLFTWGRYFLMPTGAVIGFVDSGAVTLLSFLSVGLCSGLSFLLGVVQLIFIPPRRAGWVCIGFGFVPIGLLLAMIWLVERVLEVALE